MTRKRALAGVALAAAAVRGYAVVQALDAPFLAKYPLAAQRLLAGELPAEMLLDASPFYLALTTLVTGVGLPPRETLLALQAILGVTVALVAAALARRLAPSRDGSWAGMLAGLFVAASGVAVTAGALLEPEIWLAATLLSGTAVVVTAPSAGRRFLAAGVLFGLAALIRPNALLVPLLLLLLPGLRRSALRASGVALLTAGAGLALWLGGRVPVAHWPAMMSPGQVFHQGNARDASGFGLHYPPAVRRLAAAEGEGWPDFHHQAYRIVARAETGRCLTPPAAEGFWRQKAFAAIAEQPIAAVRRAAARALGIFHRRQVWDVAGAAKIELGAGLIAPLGVPLFLPLALLAGLLPGARRVMVLLPGALTAMATAALFFASGRHQVLLEIFLATAAGVGAMRLRRVLADRGFSRRRLGAALAVAALAAIFPFLPVDSISRGRAAVAARENARDLLTASEGLRRQGAPPAVVAELAARAVVLHPPIEGELPAPVRSGPRLRQRVLELAGERLRQDDGVELLRAAAALIQMGGCDAYAEALADRQRPVAGEDRPGLAILSAGCALSGGGSPGGVEEELWYWAAEGRLPIEGHAFLAADHLLAGASLAQVRRLFPASHDRSSVDVALGEALAAAGTEELRQRLEGDLERRWAEAMRCRALDRPQAAAAQQTRLRPRCLAS